MAGEGLVSRRVRIGIAVGAFLGLSGCAMAGGMLPAADHEIPQSSATAPVSPLLVESLLPDRPAPQAAVTTAIRWTASATGGVGERTYEFLLRDREGREAPAQAGADPVWAWTPPEAGLYQVRARVMDSLGNEASSPWSDPYEIVPPLRVESLSPDRPSPQTAVTTAIRWETAATGGVGERVYEFRFSDAQGQETGAPSGPQPAWVWTPQAAGMFRVRVVVRDSLGNEASSPWSELYKIALPLRVESLQPDRPAPRMATTGVLWRAAAAGGVGERVHVFELVRGDGAAGVAQSGLGSEWSWSPSEAGSYKVRVTVRDARGNEAASEWLPYEIAPPLRFESLGPDRPAPQAVVTTAIRWTASATGGVGERTYEFRAGADGGEETVEKSGPEPEWEWTPSRAGDYRIHGVVTDALGNKAESDPSEPYRIEPKLEVAALDASRPSPQMAGAAIRWEAQATGGVGTRSYRFFLKDPTGLETPIQSGAETAWEWRPEEAGRFRVKAAVTDALGNRAESGWSEEYEVAPPLAVETPVPDRPAPQAAAAAAIRWTARASGGVGERTYEFRAGAGGGKEAAVKSGREPEWEWAPPEAGTYWLRVVVTDALGNRVESAPSEPYRIEPKLEVAALDASRPSPQMAGAAIRWEAQATGGVGTRSYRFFLKDPSGRETLVRSGAETAWDWAPQDPGDYRIRVQVTDERGNTAERGWPSEYRVAPRLSVASFSPGLPSPRAAATSIPWRAVAEGGVEPLSFDFESRRNGGPARQEASGSIPSWEWTPREAGRYEVRAHVRDSLGNVASGGWSEPYVVEAPLIAVLPFENLSASPAPLKEMREALLERLRNRGVNLPGEEEFFALMARQRVRYTGGIDRHVSETFFKEAGIGAILITSLELYSAQDPPKVALVARLTSTTEPLPTVIWADSVSLSGDDAPGFLGLGLVEDVKKLMPRALDRLASSLASRLGSGDFMAPGPRAQSRFRPRGFYRSPDLKGDKSHRIAVLPVVNHSSRKNAGELLAGIMIEQFAKAEGFEVVEPGMVRDHLLRYRIVAPEGASSLDAVDLLFEQIGVDLLLTGKVMDYDDTRGPGGAPQVTFFVQVVERRSKEVVWSSHSTNMGGAGVFFFNMGKVRTAHALASMMAANVVQRMRAAEKPP